MIVLEFLDFRMNLYHLEHDTQNFIDFVLSTFDLYQIVIKTTKALSTRFYSIKDKVYLRSVNFM